MLIPITQAELNELKLSSAHAQAFLKILQIKGWPRVITIEGKHHLNNASSPSSSWQK